MWIHSSRYVRKKQPESPAQSFSRAPPQIAYHRPASGVHSFGSTCPPYYITSISTDPYFIRNIPASATTSTPAVLARGALETRICIRTYRLFFVWGTEEFLWRIPSKEDADVASEAVSMRRQAWLAKTRAGGWPAAPATPSVQEPTPVSVPVSVT